MGTGGTLSGSGRYLKEKMPHPTIVGVDPIGSLYYEYVKTGRMTKAFSYYVEGIGEDFLPSTMNLDILDDVTQVDDKECFMMTREMVRKEGIFCGGLRRGGHGRHQVRPAAQRAEADPVLCPTTRRSI